MIPALRQKCRGIPVLGLAYPLGATEDPRLCGAGRLPRPVYCRKTTRIGVQLTSVPTQADEIRTVGTGGARKRRYGDDGGGSAGGKEDYPVTRFVSLPTTVVAVLLFAAILYHRLSSSKVRSDKLQVALLGF